jgi:hypothetical protein
VGARRAQLVSPTCGSVVEVFVDKLEGTVISNCSIARSSVCAQTYIVGGLGDVAEGGWGELGDDLFDLDVFGGRHDCGIGWCRAEGEGLCCGGGG